MVRKKDYFEFELNKKHLAIFLISFIFVFSIAYVFAFNDDWENNPVDARKVGHSPDEIILKINDQTKTLHQAILDGDLTGGEAMTPVQKIPGSEWQYNYPIGYSTQINFESQYCNQFIDQFPNAKPIISKVRTFIHYWDSVRGLGAITIVEVNGFCIG